MPAVAGTASPLARAAGGGLEIAGVVLTVGLAGGIGSPSVADLSGALLLLFLGRTIRFASLGGPLEWLAMVAGLTAVAVRWGSSSIESIQGAQGVLGLGVGDELLVAGLAAAGVGALVAFACWLAPVPSMLEERVIFGLTAFAGGAALAAVFLGRAGSEILVFGLGLCLGLGAAAFAFGLDKVQAKAARLVPAAALLLSLGGLGLVSAAV